MLSLEYSLLVSTDGTVPILRQDGEKLNLFFTVQLALCVCPLPCLRDNTLPQTAQIYDTNCPINQVTTNVGNWAGVEFIVSCFYFCHRM